LNCPTTLLGLPFFSAILNSSHVTPRIPLSDGFGFGVRLQLPLSPSPPVHPQQPAEESLSKGLNRASRSGLTFFFGPSSHGFVSSHEARSKVDRSSAAGFFEALQGYQAADPAAGLD
jgi:hypothetical protein